MRCLVGCPSCCTSLQHPKGLHHGKDQTQPDELDWVLGEKVSHTLASSGGRRVVSPELP